MKPIKQTLIGEYGNCWAASIASLLEVENIDELTPYSEIYKRGGDWHGSMLHCVYKHHGMMILSVDKRLFDVVIPRGYHIMNGPASRGFRHSVVGYCGEFVHDPHPSDAGLLSCDEWEFLVPVGELPEDEAHRNAVMGWLTRSPCECVRCV